MAWPLALGSLLVLPALQATAQTWRVEASLSVQESATNNVNLLPDAQRRSDFITQITPTLTLSEKGPRTSLSGFVSIPILLYARTGAENDNIYPSVNLVGDVSVLERFLHVEGQVSVAQQYFNPFGPQPVDLASATSNRYQTATYRVSPYIRGVTADNIAYDLRNNNVWSNLSGAPTATSNSRYTQWIGSLGQTQTRIGWKADADTNEARFNQQEPIKSWLVRFTPIFNVDPQVRLSASIGYESNDYLLTSSRDTTYGVGFEWRPTVRTDLIGNWEHRFFGSSYLLSFRHRTPLTVWNVHVARSVTTYPQSIGTLPPGVDVAGLLDSLFRSTFPDPAERQRAVDQFISDRGLPTVSSSAVPIYTQQILLYETQSASIGFIGARNVLVFSIFNSHSQPISAAGSPLPPLLAGDNDNTQTGGGVTWTHNLTPAALLSVTAQGSRTVREPPVAASTKQGSVGFRLTSPLATRTSVFAGAVAQALRSSLPQSDYTAVTAFVGLHHSFR